MGQSPDVVSTETSTAGQSTTVSGSPSTNVDTAKGGSDPIKGKPTYSLFASKSDSVKRNEAKGEGNTVPVTTTARKPANERQGRSPTRRRDRRGKLSDHWSPQSQRSMSTKRKVCNSDFLKHNNNSKLRKTDTGNDLNTLPLSSPSKSLGVSGPS